jgi:hypothetical protein
MALHTAREVCSLKILYTLPTTALGQCNVDSYERGSHWLWMKQCPASACGMLVLQLFIFLAICQHLAIPFLSCLVHGSCSSRVCSNFVQHLFGSKK